MIRSVAVLVLVFAGAGAAPAGSIQAPATVLSAYDGDTITVEATIWSGMTWRGNVRVRGVDTPEIRGQCDREKALALAARDFVREMVVGQVVTLAGVEYDKYAGRVVAAVLLPDGRDLAETLIAAGHARPYEGGARQGWC